MMEETVVNSVSQHLNRARDFEKKEHLDNALIEYSECVNVISGWLKKQTHRALCSQPMTPISYINTAIDCLEKTRELIGVKKLFDFRNRERVLGRDGREMMIEELEERAILIDEQNEILTQQMETFLKNTSGPNSPQQDAADKMGQKISGNKMQKIQLECIIRLRQKIAAEYEEEKKRKNQQASSFRVISNILHNKKEENDAIAQMISKNFDFKNKEAVSKDLAFLKELAGSEDKEQAARNYIQEIGAKRSNHPFCAMLDVFEAEYTKEFNLQGAWYNLNKAVSDVKQLSRKLTELLTNHWNSLFPAIGKSLFLHRPADKQLEVENSIYNYLLFLPVLNSVVTRVYDNLIHVYATQSQHQQITAHLNKLEDIYLEELNINEPLLMAETEYAYKDAIYTLNKLNLFMAPDDQLAIMVKAYSDMMSELEKYCSRHVAKYPQVHLQDIDHFSLFLYVISKANVDNIICICNFIEDFVGPLITLDTEAIYVLSMLEGAMQYGLTIPAPEPLPEINTETLQDTVVDSSAIEVVQTEVSEVSAEISQLRKMLEEKNQQLQELQKVKELEEAELSAQIDTLFTQLNSRRSRSRTLKAYNHTVEGTKRVLPLQIFVCEHINSDPNGQNVSIEGELFAIPISDFNHQVELINQQTLIFDLFIKDPGRIGDVFTLNKETVTNWKPELSGYLLKVNIPLDLFRVDKKALILKYTLPLSADERPVTLKTNFNPEKSTLTFSEISVSDRYVIWVKKQSHTLPKISSFMVGFTPIFDQLQVYTVKQKSATIGRTIFKENLQSIHLAIEDMPVPYSHGSDIELDVKFAKEPSLETIKQKAKLSPALVSFTTNILNTSGIKIDGCEGKQPAIGGDIFLGGCKYLLETGKYWI